MNTPLYIHDCDECHFLGTFVGEDFDMADLYVCNYQGMITVIARRSSYGPDYVSGLAFIDSEPSLGEAFKRADARGLV